MRIYLFVVILSICVIPTYGQTPSKPLLSRDKEFPIHIAQADNAPAKSIDEQWEQQKRANREVWAEKLAAISKKENTNIFFDFVFGLGDLPPLGAEYTEPWGIAAMQALARSSNREWKQINGIQTFALRIHPNTQRLDALQAVAVWIKNLDPGERKALVDGKMTWQEVDLKVRDQLMSLMYDRDLLFLLQEKANQVTLRLKFLPRIEYYSQDAGRSVAMDLSSPIDMSLLRRSSDNSNDLDNAYDIFKPLEKSMPGELDFGSGRIFTLETILDKAGKAFGTTYSVPGRSPQNLYFISGQYNRLTFEQSLAVVTFDLAAIKKAWQSDAALFKANDFSKIERAGRDILNELLQMEFKNLPYRGIDVTYLRSMMMLNDQQTKELEEKWDVREAIPARFFLEGTVTTREEIGRDRPGLAHFLAHRSTFTKTGMTKTGMTKEDFPPNSKVILKPGLQLIIGIAGFHPTSASIVVDGKKIAAQAPNQTQINIGVETKLDSKAADNDLSHQDATKLPRAAGNPQNKIAAPQATMPTAKSGN